MSKFSEYLVVVALPKMFVVAPRACVPQISRFKYAMSLIVRGAEKTSKREGSVKSACRKLWRLFYLAPLGYGQCRRAGSELLFNFVLGEHKMKIRSNTLKQNIYTLPKIEIHQKKKKKKRL